MKRCPECRRDYYDDSLLYCLEDGTALLQGSVPLPDEPVTAILSGLGIPPSGGSAADEPATSILSEPPALGGGQFVGESATEILSEPGAVATGFFYGDEPATGILSVPPAPAGGLTGMTDESQLKTAILQPPATAGGSDSAEKHSFSANRAAKPLAALVVAVLILVVGFFGYKYLAPTKQIESIAVMPFVNESGNADIEYLSDGMTETLIGSLSNLANLNVKGRSAVFRYKGKEVDTKTLGKELGVQAVLYGRVNLRGDQLSLSLELLDAVNENVIWSGKYDRKHADVVSLQGEIARDVSIKLQSKLSGADVAKVEKNTPANPETYQLYLKGQFQRNLRTRESLRQAADFFEQAIEKDPNYAPAFSGLANTYRSFPGWGLALPKEVMPQVKTAALRALKLDDSLADAHVALGGYLAEYEWDHVGAEKEFRRAVELEPNNPSGHTSLSNLLVNLKRFDEAITEGRIAADLDPLSKRLALVSAYLSARRYEEAMVELLAQVKLDPNHAETYYLLGFAYFGKGTYRDSVTSYQKYLELDVDDPVGMGVLAQSQARAGNREEALRILDRLKQEFNKRYVPGYAFACAYLGIGNKVEALKWLEKDVDDRSSFATAYSVDSSLDELRDEPRFKAMLKRLNLPE